MNFSVRPFIACVAIKESGLHCDRDTEIDAEQEAVLFSGRHLAAANALNFSGFSCLTLRLRRD